MFEGKSILITGGTGSWGNELTTQLLQMNPNQIIIYSRSELNQVNMQRKFNNPKLKFIIGDIRDYDSIKQATKDVQYIFHLAALKHVPICEEQPYEAIKTNITGVKNLINAAIENNVVKVIDVSTDKAVEPINVYGMTKAIGEKLIIHASTISENTKFVCIRAGNVLGTNGSVVPYFIDQVKRGNEITITDTEMTRYFLTLKQAIQLIFKAIKSSIGGETFVMKMPGYKIVDIASIIQDEFGNEHCSVKIIGKRPGEKVHEVLISNYEAENAYIYDKDYFIILPQINIEGLKEYYKKLNLKSLNKKEYSSNDYVLGYNEAKEMLIKGGFIDNKENNINL
ncbi:MULTISPECIES: SDR family NAD(P)-dependent oxidoreductase [Clostridium]|uniref:SDR family NAD(P)-dependent oxidoreductase n=1 Tax=Clostridium TaxID=1485 RepID=UPI0013E9736C|nr:MULTISPECIES: SDR family NAD(P)-dependent oxidoreductase [Clostridium]MBW9158424.1 polysaccharide biosynthesis protein [Clostridium tagluense]MBZ9634161.1 polysaccharide biosynthesis protein [Clostridium sp. FP1]WLC66898.1 polysaccharide biosynthesis protein [Clostridium tagluense]